MPPFDLQFSDASPSAFAEALRANSFVILRGALVPRRLSWFLDGVLLPAIDLWRTRGPEIIGEAIEPMSRYPGAPGVRRDADSYLLLAQDGCVTDRMIRYASEDRHSLYDLISDPGLWAMIAQATKGAWLESSIQAHVRSIHAQRSSETVEGVPWSTVVPAHYDYFYHRELRFCLNVWCPFSDVGPSVSTPTLAVLRQPLAAMIAWLNADDQPRDIHAAEFSVDSLAQRFGAENMVTLDLSLGDIAVFTNWTVHRTYVVPEMTKGRTSAEIRIVATDEAFYAAREMVGEG